MDTHNLHDEYFYVSLMLIGARCQRFNDSVIFIQQHAQQAQLHLNYESSQNQP